MAPEQASVLSPSPSDAAAIRLELRVASKTLPGPRGLFSGWPLTYGPIPFIERMSREYGDIFHIRMFNVHVCVMGHPEGIKHVLQENHRNYTKSFDYKILAQLLGQGLVTSEGSLWLRQRRLMQPMFHRQKIAGFGQMMTECSLEMLDRWGGLAEKREA